MLLGKLGASLLGNLLAGKNTIRGDEITIRVDLVFHAFNPLTNFEILSFIKTNLNLMVLIQEITYVKQIMAHL